MAGAYRPNDFNEEITSDFILKLLNTGKVAIDWWEGDTRRNGFQQTYYLRPRHINEGAISGSWGGVCINLTDTGCILKFHDRPYQCKMLLPKKSGCYFQDKTMTNKQQVADSWYEYQDMIQQAIKNYKNKTHD